MKFESIAITEILKEVVKLNRLAIDLGLKKSYKAF